MIRSQLPKEYKKARSNNVNHQEVREVQRGASLCLPKDSLFSQSLSPSMGQVVGRAKSPLMAWKPLWHNPRPQKGGPENRKYDSLVCWEQCMFWPLCSPALFLPSLQSCPTFSLLLSHDSCQPPLVLVYSLIHHSLNKHCSCYSSARYHLLAHKNELHAGRHPSLLFTKTKALC